MRHLLAHVLLNADHHVLVFLCDLHQANQTLRKSINRFEFQKRLLLGKRNREERDHPVKRVDVAIHRKERFDHAIGNVPVHGIFAKHVQHVFKLFALVFGLDKMFPRRNRHLQKSVTQGNRTKIHYGIAFQHNLHAAIRERRHIRHAGNHAHRVKVEHRVVERFLFHVLLCNQDNFVVMILGKFQGAERHLAAHQNASSRQRKYNSIPQREQRVRFIKVKSHILQR